MNVNLLHIYAMQILSIYLFIGLSLTMVVDEITLQGSRCGPFKPALEIIEKHQNKLKSLITSTRPLEETQAALESASKENKVVLNIN